MAIAVNNNFRLTSVYIRAAFLQSKVLDRDVFAKQIRNSGLIWRLEKPLYGLDDASHKFGLRVKEMLTNMGFQVMD